MKLKLSILAVLVLAVNAALSQGPAVKPNSKESQALAKLEKQRDAAKATYLKHKNATTRQKFIALNDQLANDTMNTQTLTPHQKYTKALQLYRYSLKVDPKDGEASKWVTEIERIYKSMGRPIPK